MKLNHARRAAAVIAILMAALASVAAAGPLAGIASAATPPTISYYPLTGAFLGSGYTAGGHVFVTETVNHVIIGSTTVTASSPCTPWVYCGKPGQIIGWLLPNPTNTLGCGWMETGTVSATDLTTGSIASEPVTWVGPC